MSGGEAGSSRDPFQLDRLAEELVARELLHPHDIDDEDSNHDLPVFVPLSHSNPYLTANVFDIEQFLLSRSHTSLQDLRSELRDYLATLKEELVKLINDDYEAFISLSTDLRGEGVRLNKLKAPLGGLRTQIEVRLYPYIMIIHSPTHLSFPKRNCRSHRTLSSRSWRSVPSSEKKRFVRCFVAAVFA